MPYLEVMDDSSWPVIYARFNGQASLDEVATYIKWYEGHLRQAGTDGKRLASINDTTPGVRISADVRKYLADWLSDIDPQVESASVANLVIAEGIAVRGALTALRWVAARHMGTIESVGSVEAAWRLACERLKAAGQVPPAAAPRWLQASMRA